jgi:uncharacterized coiled-coil DUF342 family protein
MLVQVTGTKLIRDTETMALINKDINGLEEYNMKRKMMATQKEEINNIKSEINNIKNDMSEIKQLLFKLLEGTNG